MSSNFRNAVIVLLIAVMPSLVAAGKQTVWVVDDFESYQSTTDMLATGLNTGGPWWNAYSLTQVLPGGSGDPTPPFPTTMTLGVGDPNGFIAEGESLADPNSPKSMIIHYEMPAGGRNEANFLMLAHNLGLPFDVVSTPIGNLAIVDLTQFDKAQFKIKKFSGNRSHPQSAFTMAFIAPDTSTIGYYRTQRTELPSGIMGASQDVWEILEFDLSAELLGRDDSASVKDIGTGVVAVVFGVEDEPSTSVTFAVDDIAFYAESKCARYLVGDVNGDCIVSLADLAIIAGQWLQ